MIAPGKLPPLTSLATAGSFTSREISRTRLPPQGTGCRKRGARRPRDDRGKRDANAVSESWFLFISTHPRPNARRPDDATVARATLLKPHPCGQLDYGSLPNHYRSLTTIQ